MSLAGRLLFCFGLGLALGMIALSIDRYQRMGESNQQSRSDGPVPDFVVTKGVSREFDESGQLTYEMAADRLEHYPHKQLTALTAPKIRIRDQDNKVWLATSEQGTLEGKKTLVKLKNNVQVKPVQSERVIVLHTQSMMLDTRNSTLKSDQAVTLSYESDKLYSIGLVANLNLDKLWLESNVIATHQPSIEQTLSPVE